MISIGATLVCIHYAILTYANDPEEFSENIPLVCKVERVGDNMDRIGGPNYQHLKVNCEKNVRKYNFSDNNLNMFQFWTSTDECYSIPENSV